MSTSYFNNMKIKIVLFVFALFSASLAMATPSAVIDGMVVFQDEFGVPQTPQAWEVNLSTCLVVDIDGEVEIRFASNTDWLSCQTKAGLKRKIRKIRALIDSMSDLPASDARDLKERAGWLRSYYQSLP